MGSRHWVASLAFAILVGVVLSATDPVDLEVIEQFRDGLENPELLEWPATGGDPCGTPRWAHLVCSGDRVTQIQVQNLGLKGPLPEGLNKLSKLTNLGLQRNRFSGRLPDLSGLSDLRYAYFDFNDFDSIPVDFCTGLENLEVLALDYNDFNASSGWSFPSDLRNSAQLTNFTCNNCNLVGPLPEFLGDLASLQVLLLSGNNLFGPIPASLNGSALRMLWLNNQNGEKMTGPIDIVATMESLTSLWLHGNHFSGTIPASIGSLALLKDLNLNGNQLVGLVPTSLAAMDLNALDLNNNRLMGPIPKFKAARVRYSSNAFCQATPGTPCSPEVMVLIEFLDGLNYPSRLVSAWSGNEPCSGPWLGLDCNKDGKVSVINLPKFNLTGTLSPSIAKLESLTQVRLETNNLVGSVPVNWTSLKLLTHLDLSGNNISPPLPKFHSSVTVIVADNPLLDGGDQPGTPPSGGNSPSRDKTPSSYRSSAASSPPPHVVQIKSKVTNKLAAILVPVIVAITLVIVFASIYCCKKRKGNVPSASSLVIHPRDPSDPNNMVKIVVADNTNGSATGSASSITGDSHVIESGNLVISVQVLRNVTKNFATEKELGRGGFGVVYKGDLEDGTEIAVKRMESGVITTKAVDEFESEIAVLSKVRHRHLVCLLGYSVEGNERLLVYEYMPQGALSKHLFHWKSSKMEPLSWKRRLNIALDVARGLEYLHNLAHQSFIHRDLKSSNILLGHDFRAKISDFGLVKLAPNGEKKSVVTRLAGTFGYLAPEYAVTGKITTKVDVFSFGVVLMELLTGLMALDDDRPEESQYLAAWFWHIKSDKEKLMAAIDPALGAKEEIMESITVIAELAGHCTAREPNQRPDMGHAVNVLGPLVEKWKPFDDDPEEYSGIDYSLPLNQMVKDWQESEGKDLSYMDLEDSKGSIPARPTGFADSFTSADGR